MVFYDLRFGLRFLTWRGRTMSSSLVNHDWPFSHNIGNRQIVHLFFTAGSRVSTQYSPLQRSQHTVQPINRILKWKPSHQLSRFANTSSDKFKSRDSYTFFDATTWLLGNHIPLGSLKACWSMASISFSHEASFVPTIIRTTY